MNRDPAVQMTIWRCFHWIQNRNEIRPSNLGSIQQCTLYMYTAIWMMCICRVIILNIYLNRTNNDHPIRPLCFFLCFRWARALDLGSALPKKHVFFFCPARVLDCCRFSKKKTNKFREIKKPPSLIRFLIFSKKEKLNKMVSWLK